MRRAVSVSIVLAVLSGFLVLASPARATAVGTVTVRYVPLTMSYTVTPSSLSGAVGDTFTLADTMISGDGDPAVYVSLQDESGSVSQGGASCAGATDCPVLDLFSGAATGVFTIEAPGTLKVLRADGAPPSLIGTLTISAGGGGGSGDGSSGAAQTYTLRFTLPDGTECTDISPQTVTGGWVALPGRTAACTINGAPIVGWKARGSQQILPAGMQVDVTGDQNFTAVLDDPNVWVEFDANVDVDDPCLNARGANLTTAAARVSALYRRKDRVWIYRSAVCSPPNAKLVGWNTSADGEGTSVALGSVVPPADLIGVNVLTLYAMWEVAEGAPVTITWRAAGGTCTITTSKLARGSAFAGPAEQVCTRPGYELAGWKKKADGSSAWLDGNPVTRNTVAYAQWIPIVNVPIMWGVPGCTDTIVSGTVSFALPATSPCTTALTLGSFNSKSDGSGDSYAVGAPAVIQSTETLYAQWIVPITYDANGGTCTPGSGSPALGSEFDLPQETACTRANYALAGWTLPAATAGSQPVIVPLTAVQTATEPKTYTAIWTLPATLTFEGNGGACTISQRTIGLFGSFTLPGPDVCTRAGFELAAWKLKGTESTFPVPSDSYQALVPATFVAQWVPKVTVTFERQGSDCAIDPIEVGTGLGLVVPGAGECQRTGYAFKGWDVVSGAQADQSSFYRPATTYVVHAASVLRARWSGKPSCDTPAGPGVDWQGCDKRGATLQGADLTGANLDGTNFDGADLTGANLTSSTTDGINLSGATLVGTNLTGLDLAARSAKLARAVFSRATCSRTDGCESTLPDFAWSFQAANLSHADLNGQDLSDATLSGVLLVDANLTKVNLSRTRLWLANLTGARTNGLNLTGADLRRAVVEHVDLSSDAVTLTDTTFSSAEWVYSSGFKSWGVWYVSLAWSDLSGQDLRNRYLERVKFVGANLAFADLRGATVWSNDVSQANLPFANLAGAGLLGFAGANLAGADLTGAKLLGLGAGANLTGANLTGADVTADVKGAVFTNAKLTGASFTLANSKEDTPKLPGDPNVTYIPSGYLSLLYFFL